MQASVTHLVVITWAHFGLCHLCTPLRRVAPSPRMGAALWIRSGTALSPATLSGTHHTNAAGDTPVRRQSPHPEPAQSGGGACRQPTAVHRQPGSVGRLTGVDPVVIHVDRLREDVSVSLEILQAHATSHAARISRLVPGKQFNGASVPRNIINASCVAMHFTQDESWSFKCSS